MRVLLISDVHANWEALSVVLESPEMVDVNQIWFLGDLVGYGPDPKRCWQQLKDRITPGFWLAGNHDRGLTGQLLAGHFNANAWWVLSERHIPQCAEIAAPTLADIPSCLQISTEGIWLLHGRMADREADNLTGRTSYIFEYPQDAIYAEDSWRRLASMLPDKPPRIILGGHAHWQFLWRRDPAQYVTTSNWGCSQEDESRRDENRPIDLGTKPVWINPGSVGQPRDGDPRLAYAVLDLEANSVTFFRREYDIARTQKKMDRQGYPPRLIERLEYGR